VRWRQGARRGSEMPFLGARAPDVANVKMLQMTASGASTLPAQRNCKSGADAGRLSDLDIRLYQADGSWISHLRN
jgi:hypothetical protein